MAPRAEARDVGEEPDVRFTLAHERTYPGWTGPPLPLTGGARAAGRLLDSQRGAARRAVALPPIVLGAVLALTSYRRWEDNQRALRLGEPLPSGGPPRLLAAGIGAVALVIAVIVVADALSR